MPVVQGVCHALWWVWKVGQRSGLPSSVCAGSASTQVTSLAHTAFLQLEVARAQAQAAEQRCQGELAGVEMRVKAALARKDDVIAGLREQLAHITTQLAEEGD